LSSVAFSYKVSLTFSRRAEQTIERGAIIRFHVTLKYVTSDVTWGRCRRRQLTAPSQMTSKDASRLVRLVLRDEYFPVRITFKRITRRDSNLMDKSFFETNIFSGSIPVAARSETSFNGDSPALIAGSNHAGGMDVLLRVLCVVR
jgi:hypothetical protein